MKNFIFCCLFAILASCGETGQRSETVPTSDTATVKKQSSAPVSDPYQGCFRSVTGRDTLTLHLERKGDRYTGRMHFDNFEKDASQGPVNGSLQNGNLHLWYSFDSEGMHSVMEVVLKPEAKGLVRAMGAITNRGDTAVFQHPDALDFPGQAPLQKVDCSELKAEEQ